MTCPVHPQEHQHEWIENQWDLYESPFPVYFPVGYVMPRACSHCGGAHPEDLITLARAGWELEDNRRLQPPGYLQAMERLTGSLIGHLLDYVRCPQPPVKAYAKHFTPEQLQAFNDAITERFALK